MSTFLTRSSLAFSVLKRRGVVTSSAGVCSRFGGRQQPHLLFQNTPRYFSTSAIRMSALDDKLSGKRVVPVKECIEVHGEPGVVFIDGSWFLKDRNGRQEFEAGPRIPGAKFFDIDDIAAKGELNKKGLPHMMPPMKLFEAAMDAMDISDDDHLILYSSKGCVSYEKNPEKNCFNEDIVELT